MTNDIRNALDGLVADITVPAGFAETAVSLRRRSRRRRLAAGSGITFSAVALLAVGLSIPGRGNAPSRLTTTPAPPASQPPPSAPTAQAVVDGVAVTTLPSGLTPGQPDLEKPLNSPGSLRVTESFTEAQATSTGYLAVAVQRGAPTDLTNLAAMLSENRGRTTTHTTINGHPGLISADPKPTGTTFIEWVLSPELSLSVTTTTGFITDAALVSVATGLVDDGSPGQPADPAAAVTAIRYAFTVTFGSGSTHAQRLSTVASGSRLAGRVLAPYEGDLDYLNKPVTVPDKPADLIFTDPTHAVLLYSASNHNDPSGTASTPGAAVEIDGSWRVASHTWCSAVGIDACPTP